MDKTKLSNQVSDFSRFFGSFLAVRFVGSFFSKWIVRIGLGVIIYFILTAGRQ